VWPAADGASLDGVDDPAMGASYPVVWREGPGPLAVGKLEFLAGDVRLDGLAGTEPAVREVPYETVVEVRVERSARGRIEGRPTVVLERAGDPPIAISTVVQPGLVGEIAEMLGSLRRCTEKGRRPSVVVPLPEGSH
jgi:hypothetical protein